MEYDRPEGLPRGARHSRRTGIIWTLEKRSKGYKKVAHLLDEDVRLRRVGKIAWMLIEQLEASGDTLQQ